MMHWQQVLFFIIVIISHNLWRGGGEVGEDDGFNLARGGGEWGQMVQLENTS